MFNPGSDLTAIQRLLVDDEKLMTLMNLTGEEMDLKINEYIRQNPGTDSEVAKNIILSERILKRSDWDGLATNEKRLCIYFIPDRGLRNENFLQANYEIDIHVPNSQSMVAWDIQKRVKKLMHKKKINKRYVYFNGQLGELPTMTGFFCCGSRYNFSRVI